MTDTSTRAVTLTQPHADLPSASEFEVMQRMSRMFQESGLYKNVANVAQAIAIVQTGRELGIGPSMALREMYIIPGQGRPTLSAALLGALVQRDHGDGAIRVVESTNDVCRVQYRRRSWEKPQEIMFTMEDARRAELVKAKSNWEKYPRAMLRSRAVSEACRAGFSDSIMGLYSTEELAPDSVTVTPDGEIVYEASATADSEIIEGEQVVEQQPQAVPDPPADEQAAAKEQARQLATRINGLCDALSRERPQGVEGLAQLGTDLGLHAPEDGRFSIEWREQVIVRLEHKLAARRAAELAPPIVTGPPTADTETTPAPSGEPWGEPDVLNALAAANAADTESIALAIINAHAAGTLTNDTASALAACVDLAERAFKATSAGQIAQVEIDAKASTALNADQFNAVSSLTRRVRAMSGWAGSNGTNSRPPAVAATAGAGGR